MDEVKYFKDPPQLIMDLMKTTFKGNFTYFLESPTELIAEAAYPALIVESATSNNTLQGAPTGTDIVSEQINIHVIFSSKDDANATDDKEVTKRRLYQLIQGRNRETGYYLPNTILYALRTNISLFNNEQPTVIDSEIDVNYSVAPREDNPALVAATVSIVTKEQVQIQVRV